MLQGDSDLQLERMNVYFNEASGGERAMSFLQLCRRLVDSPVFSVSFLNTCSWVCRSLRAPSCVDGPGMSAFPLDV